MFFSSKFPSKFLQILSGVPSRISFGVTPEIYLDVFPTGDKFRTEFLPGFLPDFLPELVPGFFPMFHPEARSFSRNFCTSSILDFTDAPRNCLVVLLNIYPENSPANIFRFLPEFLLGLLSEFSGDYFYRFSLDFPRRSREIPTGIPPRISPEVSRRVLSEDSFIISVGVPTGTSPRFTCEDLL